MIVQESTDLNIGGQSYYIQDYAHPENHIISNYTYKITPGFKPFNMYIYTF